MRIHNNTITRSLSVLALAIGLTACLDAQEGAEPEAQAEQVVQVQEPAAKPAQQPAVQPEQQPAQPKAQTPDKAAGNAGDKAADKAKSEPKSKPVEEMIEPEVQASIPDVISKEDNTRLQAQYKETLNACTEIRTVCIDDGNEEAKCIRIENGCKEAAESLRSGSTTRAGLLSVLKSLVEGVLGVGDAAVSLFRCGSRLIGCAFSTLSLHCAADFVECVVEEVIAK